MFKAVKATTLKNRKPDYSGKVRDIYFQNDNLIIVSTDRVSAYDCILNEPVPGRGVLLTKISLFWFDMMKPVMPNHIVSADVSDFPPEFAEIADDLEGRAVLCKKADRIDFECIVRGYLTGGGYKEYQKTGKISGIDIPAGMGDGDKFDNPIFTPTTKAEEGHDMPVSFDEMKAQLQKQYPNMPDLADTLKNLSIGIYEKGRDYALERGIVLVDTKFEFGLCDGELILIDEILTPDSSRFWSKDDYDKGELKSFDKQIIRDYLKEKGFTGDGEPPALTDEVIEETVKKYQWILDALQKG